MSQFVKSNVLQASAFPSRLAKFVHQGRIRDKLPGHIGESTAWYLEAGQN